MQTSTLTSRRLLAALVIASASVLSPLAAAQAEPPHEDDLGWSCVDDGNRICGPDNDEGVQPGQYDTGGVLIPWPHEYVPSWCKDICLGA